MTQQWTLQTPEGELRFGSSEELLNHLKTQVYDLLTRSPLAHPVIRDGAGQAYDIMLDLGLEKVGYEP